MDHNEQLYIDFDTYIRQGDGNVRQRANNWQTAIGLQAVDGLKTSQFLQETAQKHIEGVIDIDEAGRLIEEYYQSKVGRTPEDDGMQEADIASKNITKILSTGAFAFDTNGFISTHRRIFEGVFKHAGKLRDYDISKREWVLEGESVSYLNWEDLRQALDYDIGQERSFSYNGLSMDDVVRHISLFVSGLWQIHPFCEGNTRTTAVFTILYLRSIGFYVNNDIFRDNSWYFRNALVRANYKNASKGIDYSPQYLERFFRNLLMGESWVLKNRYLHIGSTDLWKEQPQLKKPDQVPDQVPVQVQKKDANIFLTNNLLIKELVVTIGEGRLSVKQLMEAKGLKQRPNFMEYHLNPAINEGFVQLQYPGKPNHPRQKYMLTVKGLALYNEMRKL